VLRGVDGELREVAAGLDRDRRERSLALLFLVEVAMMWNLEGLHSGRWLGSMLRAST
jgi:hypothetical protein